MIARASLVLLCLMGACGLYDAAIGDGPLPRLNNLSTVSTGQAHTNTTAQLAGLTPSTEQGWQALNESRSLLIALSPEIAEWIYDLRREERIVFEAPNEATTLYRQTETSMVLAAYRPMNGKLYIGPAFWRLNDGQKVAVLVHEYRHARQNLPKRVAQQLGQLLTGGFRYQSRLEAEAFDYERQALAALGLSPLEAVSSL